MRLGKSRFVEIGFYKSSYDDVVGYYKHKGSQHYWFEGYSRIYNNFEGYSRIYNNNIKFWI